MLFSLVVARYVDQGSREPLQPAPSLTQPEPEGFIASHRTFRKEFPNYYSYNINSTLLLNNNDDFNRLISVMTLNIIIFDLNYPSTCNDSLTIFGVQRDWNPPHQSSKELFCETNAKTALSYSYFVTGNNVGFHFHSHLAFGPSGGGFLVQYSSESNYY
mgnify:CR=1 FL=1